jgi:hypothetical protein
MSDTAYWISLNVGGRIFTTSRDTLIQPIDEHGHLLAVMFSSENTIPLSKDRKGNILIDRNGKIFEYILDFLRNGGDMNKCVFPVEDNELLQRVIVEADYFQLTSIVQWFRSPVPDPILSTEHSENIKIEFEGEGYYLVNRPIIVNPGVFSRNNRGYNSIEIIASGNEYKQEIVGRQMGIGITNGYKKNISRDMLACVTKTNAFDVEALSGGYKRRYRKLSVFVDPLRNEIWSSENGGNAVLVYDDVYFDQSDTWYFVVYNLAKDVSVKVKNTSFKIKTK